jgi:hypothetical protein
MVTGWIVATHFHGILVSLGLDGLTDLSHNLLKLKL